MGSEHHPGGFGGHPSARPYKLDDEGTWDAFVAQAWNGTLLHTRRYLSYHGARFEDRSLVIEEDGEVVGLLPAAVDPGDARHVVSHPGLTYGGLLTAGQLRGEATLRALEACAGALREQGYGELTYKSVPTLLQRLPSEDDLYALWRLGAALVRTDLWAWVPATRSQPLSRQRRRALARAASAGVTVEQGGERLPDFWTALTDNLRERHGVDPVHSLAEIALLAERFPDQIALYTAVNKGGDLMAGALSYLTPGAQHIQYSSSTVSGREIGALDAVYEHIVESAAARGLPTSFGASTEAGGTILNTPLYYFKASFGATSLAHQFFKLMLT